MSIALSYPGIYIREVRSATHSITAAPTSITVFVGYTHPLKTLPANVGKAVRLFSFNDYQSQFGGFFDSDAFSDDSAHFGDMASAVSQFFLNGGSDAYVVGLRPSALPAAGQPGGTSTKTFGATPTAAGITFTALEPTDDAHKMNLSIAAPVLSSPPLPGPPRVDLTITYGTGPGAVAETYRRVIVDPTFKTDKDYIGRRVGTAAAPVSALVAVDVPGDFAGHLDSVSTDFDAWPMLPSPPPPAGGPTLFSPADFAAVFQEHSSLDRVPIFNLLVVPGVTDLAVLSEAVAFAEGKRAFAIFDAPESAVTDPNSPDFAGNALVAAPKSKNAAIYFPYLQSENPITGAEVDLPPSGTVAGIFARTDANRGVWKAPAGLETTLINVAGVVESGQMNDPEHGVLNLAGVDCLREFTGVGTVVFGARTTVSANSAYQDWKYVPVRRMALFLEQSLYAGLGWVVFEPNDEPLWASIRNTVNAFMLGLFRQGAFAGATPSVAFQVKCDANTTTPTDQLNGTVNLVVAFAPLEPAEFVVISIAQLAGQVQSAA